MKPIAFLALAFASGGVMAQESKEIKELLQASGCMSCHATDEKLVGPSFKSIGAKYAGQADAVDTLTQSVRNGSRGKWGRVPMPAHSALSASDVKTLATWVLQQKP